MTRRQATLLVALLAVFVVLRGTSAPPWPDDWDGIGFLASITRFDLDHFAPHAPGYPVYVALLKGAALVVRNPILAANLVAVQCGVAATVLISLTATRAIDGTRGMWVGAFVGIAPLAWRAGTSIGSEAPALMFMGAATFAATLTGRRSAWWMGMAVGLGLGVRLSWAPLYLSLLALAPRGERLRACAVAAATTLMWVVPFACTVGPAHLAALVLQQASGHFHTWGGTTLQEPGLMRGAWLMRDLFVDGLGVDSDTVGLALGVVVVLLAVLGLGEWRENGYPHARLGWLLAPYAIWMTLGQNLHQQPRHALPIVVALAACLAVAASSSRHPRTLGVAFFGLLALRTSADAHARATPPPGDQLTTFAESLSSSDRPVAVLAGPSARFFDLAPHPNVFVATVSTLGEADLALGRFSPFPSRILVTGELIDLPRGSRALTSLTTLCREPRVDRRAPCLDVYDWRPPYLRR